MWCHYNAVNFLQNIPNRHPIAHLWGWGMRCLLWTKLLIDVLLQLLQYCMEHHIILNPVIAAPNYLCQVNYCSIPSWLKGGLSAVLMVPTIRSLTALPTPLQSWWNHRSYIVGTNPKQNTNQWSQTANLNWHIYTWNRETSKAIT